MHHSRQPVRAVSSSVRAHRGRKHISSTVQLDDPATGCNNSNAEASSMPTALPLPAYEPSWRRTGRSSMAADVRIPSFLIPFSASQLMDDRYKSRKFAGVKAISPAA